MHHHKKDEGEKSKQEGSKEGQKKETEMEKFKDYMAEDRKLEEEGKEYGGLM